MIIPTTANPTRRAESNVLASPQTRSPRNRYRERDFGIGYGRSEGYATGRRFSDLRGIRLSRYS